jgi:hypothetical protein
MDTHSDGLWCLPVNPQFGLLLVLDGTFPLEENEVRVCGITRRTPKRNPPL